MRLRTTLVGLLVVISLVLGATVYAGFALHKASIAEGEKRTLEITADSVAQEIDAHLSEKRTAVVLTAGANGVGVHGSPEQRAALRRLLADAGFDGASVVAANGTMVDIVTPDITRERRRALIGRDFSDRAYVQAALSGHVSVGNPLHAESGNHIVTISAPIRRNGTVVGTVNGALHLQASDFFDPLTRFLEPNQGLHLAFGNSSFSFGSGAEVTDRNASETVERTDWQVVVDDHGTGLSDSLWWASLVQLVAVAITILAVALVGIWVERSTIRNLDSLIDGLSRLERGDYDTSVDLGATAEWDRISSQFNALAETLAQRESQLTVLDRVLRHNLRNDMSVVIAHVDTMLEAEDLPPARREKLRAIRRTADGLIDTSEHARTIHAELLGDGQPARKPVDLAAVVERIAGDLVDEYPAVTIETDLPASAWVANGDTMPVVAEELCRNAVDQNDLPPERRTLSVDLRHVDDEVRLDVSDNGPGLPAGEAAMVRGERPETDVDHGSGLGLWVVQWLVNSVGGDIGIQNRRDRGTTITVRVPAAKAPPDQGELALPGDDRTTTDETGEPASDSVT